MKRTESGTSFQEWHERNASIVVEENQQLNMEVDMFFDSKEDPIITDNAFYNDDDVNIKLNDTYDTTDNFESSLDKVMHNTYTSTITQENCNNNDNNFDFDTNLEDNNNNNANQTVNHNEDEKKRRINNDDNDIIAETDQLITAQNKFVDKNIDIRKHFEKKEKAEDNNIYDETTNTIDILDDLLKTTGDTLQNLTKDEQSKLMKNTVNNNNEKQIMKKKEKIPSVRTTGMLNDADGQPIQSFNSLKNALKGIDHNNIDNGKKDNNNNYNYNNNEIMQDNKIKVKSPVRNYLNVTTNRQKNILIRERKHLERMQTLAKEMKRKSKLYGKNVLTNSYSLPNLRGNKTNTKRHSKSRNIVRKLRKEVGSYSRRQALQRNYLIDQRRKKITKERHNENETIIGNNVQIMQLNSRSGSERIIVGNSNNKKNEFTSEQYENIKRDREQEIYDRVLSIRSRINNTPTQNYYHQRDDHDEGYYIDNMVMNNNNDNIIYPPSVISRNTPLYNNNYQIQQEQPLPTSYSQQEQFLQQQQQQEDPYAKSYNAAAIDSGFVLPSNYPSYFQRRHDAENIILTKNARILIQNNILQNANLKVQQHARQSEAKKRTLSNLLYNSQLTNTWDRFDSSVNEQLNVNQHMMENLEYPSLLQPLNNNYNNHLDDQFFMQNTNNSNNQEYSTNVGNEQERRQEVGSQVF